VARFSGLLALLGLVAFSGLSAQNPVFRAGIQAVPVYATVRDADGRLVGSLAKTDFQILDNGKPVVITNFSNEIVPITVVLLLDMSASMTRDYARVRDAAMHLVDGLFPQDRVRVGTFGTEVFLSPLLTSDKPTLKRILREELWLGGHTPLWRASKQAMASLEPEAGRRVVLLLTDGSDDCEPTRWSPNVSPVPCSSEAEVRKLAIEGDFLFYAIGLEGSGLDKGVIRLANESGGGHFKLERSANLSATFETVADELHHQYLLGFTPAVLDGTVHQLEVKLTKPDLTAKARQFYVATPGK
jgi:Ca-activated chloride channel family protein